MLWFSSSDPEQWPAFFEGYGEVANFSGTVALPLRTRLSLSEDPSTPLLLGD